jgi:hypothetical protein
MLYVRLQAEAPPVALQELSRDLPAGTILEVALNLWGQDEEDGWELVTENGTGVVVDDLDRPLADYDVQAEDLLLLRKQGS